MDRLAARRQIAVGIASVVVAVLILVLWLTTPDLGPNRTMWHHWLVVAGWVLLVYLGVRMLLRGLSPDPPLTFA